MASLVVALIDLPLHSTISVNGKVVQTQTDDFVGFGGLPIGWNLVTVRSGATTCGFVLQDESLLRRYDPRTEEVSPEELDAATRQNLVTNLPHLPPSRLVPYSQLLDDTQLEAWKQAHSCISRGLLKRRRIDALGKIVPGSSSNESETISDIDGTAVAYPSVPILDALGHGGTKRFLQRLSPQQRTLLFREESPSDAALQLLIDNEYGEEWKDLVGDLQLAFLLFVHLHCFASFEHWRDLVVLVSKTKESLILHEAVVQVLAQQLTFLDADLLEEDESNCLVQAMTHLALREDVNGAPKLRRILQNRFPVVFAQLCTQLHEDMSDDDEDDRPVVLSEAEYAQSLDRFAKDPVMAVDDSDLRHRYPILAAAKQPHEDVLMTCARALDEKVDVSLVREAADYLEQVEARR